MLIDTNSFSNSNSFTNSFNSFGFSLLFHSIILIYFTIYSWKLVEKLLKNSWETPGKLLDFHVSNGVATLIPSSGILSLSFQFSKISVFFSRSNFFIIFQEGPFVPQTDMNFPGGFICSSNKHEFSRRVYQSISLSNRPYYVIKQILNFPRNPYLEFSNTCEFSRSLYFLIKQILIFQEPLISFSNTYDFPGDPI